MTFSGARRRAIWICHRAVVKTAGQLPLNAGLLAIPRIPAGVAPTVRSTRIFYIFGIPPPGNIPPMPRIILAIPPLAENFFIIF